ncbi:PucR family transcriptional regulator [Yinghuangia soli]|uniref:Helix-turn-helix domain-containing protein n=1 Tax=Yinghuangia soli TaxID=2908204 RepID=A0AA41Q0U5_9ACTN|nr:helix-turn-helix domain-containing protein [Yinghuangia soli]MCF2528890.1 helix-turn-helix domain-containing protein [Yinghuangia soli]
MGSSSRKVLTAAALRMTDQIPEISERVVRQIIAQEPTYQSHGLVPREVLSRSVNSNVGRILRVLAGAQVTDKEEVATAFTTGRQRARQGVPLEAVLRAYRLAAEVLMHTTLAEAEAAIRGDMATFRDVATAIMKVSDRHSEAVVAGYRETEAEQQRRDDQLQQAMFDALLDGRGSDPDFAREALAALGLPQDGPYVVLVSRFDVASHAAFSPARDTCAAYLYRAAWRIRAGHEVGIAALGRSNVDRLVAALRAEDPGCLGVSDAIGSVRDVPAAYRMAEVALLTVANEAAEVAWIAERLPEALVVSSPALATRLARGALGPVLDLPPAERDVLLRTLSVWYQEGRSASRAAARLFCHRNTIMNRLRRVEGLNGNSLEDHRYLLACYLGLLTLELMPAAVPFPAEAAATT